MTIRNDYQNAADFVAGYVNRKEPIPVHAASKLLDELLDLAALAQLLENVTIRPEVVVLPNLSTARDAR
jgi:hypothetical protein